MTTVIYDCDAGDISPQSITRLANMYHESEATTEWQPGEDLPEKLVITPISKEIAEQLDIAEEDLIHIDEAMELLQSDLSYSDIITHGNEKIVYEVITPLQELKSVISGIESLLSDSQTPEYKKADYRCLISIFRSIQAEFGYVDEPSITTAEQRKKLCAHAIRGLRSHIGFTYAYTLEGKFHDQRSHHEEPTT